MKRKAMFLGLALVFLTSTGAFAQGIWDGFWKGPATLIYADGSIVSTTMEICVQETSTTAPNANTLFEGWLAFEPVVTVPFNSCQLTAAVNPADGRILFTAGLITGEAKNVFGALVGVVSFNLSGFGVGDSTAMLPASGTFKLFRAGTCPPQPPCPGTNGGPA